MRKFRRYRPRKGPLPFRYVLIITFMIFVFSTIASLWIINEGIKPTLVTYAETQTKAIAAKVISKAVNKKVANAIDINDIIETVPSGDGKGTTVTKFNTEIINRVLGETTTLVQLNLKEAERGNLQALELLSDVEIENKKMEKSEGIVYSVPLGQATNNALLGNLGPRVPIRFNAIGNVRSDVKSNVKPYGINNAFVEVSIRVQVNVQIIVPFATKMTTVEQDIPVAMGIIEGGVPQFYNGGSNQAPTLTVPVK
ncbi:sporulation protein YunB [Oikeobacillus pervagus]|uniref:Sporulation protein YunB n=1 Tax=Oikeobacillus pervagus TaxID=1325931 RepID=A0AAJ1WJ86_9BACI|nr:sporulation protein YunB [Oikeobacillus pervagus]MDQ0215158.1 sporulation protein YunB [Oikeobacillus pervagus]